MATLNLNGRLTIVEAAKSMHNGEMLKVAEILYRQKPAIQHGVWKQANDMMSNVESQRYSLPTGTWRQFNQTVTAQIGRRKQIRDSIGMLSDYFKLDKDLVDIQPDPMQYRMDEVVGGMEGLSQTWATQLWYGNTAANLAAWTGLAPRMAALNSTTIQGCSGTGAALTSMYIVMWDMDTVFMVYPRGSEAWLNHRDLGEQTMQLTNSGNTDVSMMQVYMDYFEWNGGLVVKDPLAVGRVCNIIPTGNVSQWSDDVFIRVITQMRNSGGGGMAYVTRNVKAQLLIAIKDKGNVWFSEQDPFGSGEVPTLLGTHIYTDEMISEAETQVS